MKYLEPILVFSLIISIGAFVYIKEFPKDNIKIKVKEVTKLETKVKYIKDTITRVELRLKKAKAIHDTVEIIKEQDTLIQFLKIETIIQDTIIKKQDTLVIDCENALRKQKNKGKLNFAIGFGIGFGAGVLFGMAIKK